MKKQFLVCLTFIITAAAISASQNHYDKPVNGRVSVNDTVPAKNKTKSSDSAKEWHNNADNPKDTLYPRRDSNGHPNTRDTTLH